MDNEHKKAVQAYVNHCVMEAFEHNKGSEKIDEIIDILSKVINK